MCCTCSQDRSLISGAVTNNSTAVLLCHPTAFPSYPPTFPSFPFPCIHISPPGFTFHSFTFHSFTCLKRFVSFLPLTDLCHLLHPSANQLPRLYPPIANQALPLSFPVSIGLQMPPDPKHCLSLPPQMLPVPLNSSNLLFSCSRFLQLHFLVSPLVSLWVEEGKPMLLILWLHQDREEKSQTARQMLG